MNASDPLRWTRIESLFDRAWPLDPAARSAFLAREAGDPAIHAEVLRLLSAADAAHGSAFLESRATQKNLHLAIGSLVDVWCIDAPLGQGGMGEVYAVSRQGQDFTQRGALKLLTELHSADARRRFADERRVLARLHHPGIAHLLDGGEHRGVPYAVMEFIEGVPLTTAAQGLPLAQRLALFEQVCAAVRHAHRHLIVHRDLKPGNILVTPEGRIKLLDFGIAKSLDTPDGSLSQEVRVSPDYCAPEQLRGEDVTVGTDVYALGAILYELLCGQPLWNLAGVGVVRALQRLNQDEPLPPSRRTTGKAAQLISGDLDAITRKALHHDPEQRYASVTELADDLRAWRELRPVRARSGGWLYRVQRSLQRHRGLFIGSVVLLSALLLGLAGTLWQAGEAAIERDRAQRQAERADAVRHYLMLMFRSAGDQADGRSITAKAVLDHASSRLHQEFIDEPEQYGSIALALAELYLALDDYTGAQPLLERLLDDARLQPLPIGEDERAMAQHDLAQILVRVNDADRAAQLLTQAQTFWQQRAPLFRDELIESRLLQSQIERAQGQPEQALRTLQAALPERIALSGQWHRETGKLINNLGIAHFQLGQFDAAITQFESAQAIWQQLHLARSADALNTLNNWASAEVRRQRLDAALPLFERALQLRRALYPASAALAALLSNYGKTLLQSNRADEALPLLDEAVRLATQYAGHHSVLTVSAQLGLADAQCAGADWRGCTTTLDAAADTIDTAYGDRHVLAAMLMLSRARLAYGQGYPTQASAQLAHARRILLELAGVGAAYLPQVDALQQQWQWQRQQPQATLTRPGASDTTTRAP
ncbi:serine/threonine-protein kinase [Sinimarinibacterium sp. NLF-5-8]|uniref:serine/threonine-protein kinase n=1 Tax=Sinimarinibacterium sp. NLF-5-8 TaxID=2698684 RepID=UPI00137C2621|nr:serine/threonine-protein kinase [Sinimarinibacterium sp. NLF-5-8]QHS10594.1 serine/threonine protein kinase [Sinimarinibacterium sp. NLF-5-8]